MRFWRQEPEHDIFTPTDQKPGCSNRTTASSVSQSPERNHSSVVTLGFGGPRARNSGTCPESGPSWCMFFMKSESPDLCSLSHIAVLCLYTRLVHPWPLLFSSLSLLELLTQQIDSEDYIQGLFMVLGKGPQTLQEGAWRGWAESQICGSTPLMLQPQLCGERVFLDVSRGLRQMPGRRWTLELPLADGAWGWEDCGQRRERPEP